MTHKAEARAYLIRLSTYQRQPLLGHHHQGKLCLSDYGTIVAHEWERSAANRSGVDLDLWVVTPAGLESIVIIQMPPPTWATPGISGLLPSQKPWLLSSFIASFKAAAAKRINLCRNLPGQPVWQSNYHEQKISTGLHLAQCRDQLRATAG
ncbi:MAG: hypothetical protein ACFCVD_12795 [Nodosilinea sp.]